MSAGSDYFLDEDLGHDHAPRVVPYAPPDPPAGEQPDPPGAAKAP